MLKRKLGRSELEVTVVIMGCWQAGVMQWPGISDEESIQAMRAAYEAGINCFDTAQAYGSGHSEEILAKAMHDHRNEVLYASKVKPGGSSDKVIEACDRSLQRLRTDRIDLYQLHWPSGTFGTPIVPIEETMRGMLQLQQQGKVRAVGVSNFDAAQVREALQYGTIDSLQPPYSLFWRVYEDDGTIATCIDHQIGILAYSPMAQGLLTGKFNRSNRPSQDDDNRAQNILFQDPTYEKALEAVERLRTIADKYQKTTGQLALRWLIDQPGVTAVIAGARNVTQVQGNAEAADFSIEQEDLEEINRIGRTVTDGLPSDQTNMWGY